MTNKQPPDASGCDSFNRYFALFCEEASPVLISMGSPCFDLKKKREKFCGSGGNGSEKEEPVRAEFTRVTAEFTRGIKMAVAMQPSVVTETCQQGTGAARPHR